MIGKFKLENINSHLSSVIVVPNTENLSNFILCSVNTLVLGKNVFKKINNFYLWHYLSSIKENAYSVVY